MKNLPLKHVNDYSNWMYDIVSIPLFCMLLKVRTWLNSFKNMCTLIMKFTIWHLWFEVESYKKHIYDEKLYGITYTHIFKYLLQCDRIIALTWTQWALIATGEQFNVRGIPIRKTLYIRFEVLVIYLIRLNIT